MLVDFTFEMETVNSKSEIYCWGLGLGLGGESGWEHSSFG